MDNGVSSVCLQFANVNPFDLLPDPPLFCAESHIVASNPDAIYGWSTKTRLASDWANRRKNHEQLSAFVLRGGGFYKPVYQFLVR